jgi:hypothetical protein
MSDRGGLCRLVAARASRLIEQHLDHQFRVRMRPRLCENVQQLKKLLMRREFEARTLDASRIFLFRSKWKASRLRELRLEFSHSFGQERTLRSRFEPSIRCAPRAAESQRSATKALA